jgi:hypothetical protein
MRKVSVAMYLNPRDHSIFISNWVGIQLDQANQQKQTLVLIMRHKKKING